MDSTLGKGSTFSFTAIFELPQEKGKAESDKGKAKRRRSMNGLSIQKEKAKDLRQDRLSDKTSKEISECNNRGRGSRKILVAEDNVCNQKVLTL